MFDPNREFWDILEDIYEFFEGTRPRLLVSRVYRPPANVFETDTEIIIQISLSGTRKEDIKLELSGEYLTIKGIRRDLLQDEERKYHTVEIFFGPFERKFCIGKDIDPDNIETCYRDGLLTIRIPKKEKREIEIKIIDEEGEL